jgi:hypothetical protein
LKKARKIDWMHVGFRAEIAKIAEIEEISKMGASHQSGEVAVVFSNISNLL